MRRSSLAPAAGGGGRAATADAESVAALAADEALQLSRLEAAHVSAALHALVGKLALLSGLAAANPHSSQAEQLTRTVGEEMSAMMQRQQALQQRYQELLAARPAGTGSPAAARGARQASQAQLAEVSDALREATKQLCRNLQDNPNITDNLAKVSAEREAVAALFAHTLQALAADCTVRPLVAAVLAAEHAETHMQQLVERERSATALVKALRGSLAAEKEQHEQQMRDKRQALHALKAELQHEKLQLATAGSHHAKELAAANQTEQRLQAAELQQMQEELARIRQQQRVEAGVSAAELAFLAAKASTHRGEGAAWAARREEDAQAKARELEVLRGAHSRAREVLAEVQARQQEELAAKEARDASAAKEAEERAEQAALEARRLAGAIRIQACWRGFIVRSRKKAGSKKQTAKGGGAKKKKT